MWFKILEIQKKNFLSKNNAELFEKEFNFKAFVVSLILKFRAVLRIWNFSLSQLIIQAEQWTLAFFCEAPRYNLYWIFCYKLLPSKQIIDFLQQYFSSIFDNNPLPITGMLYIVLPPELSRRAVATLIQYMYTGEGNFQIKHSSSCATLSENKMYKIHFFLFSHRR